MRPGTVGLALLVGAGLVVAGCSSGSESSPSQEGGAQENSAQENSAQDAAPVVSCTSYPSLGSVTPADLPLPTTPTQSGGDSQMVQGKSVTGPTSYFGGPAGGAPGPFSLTQVFPADQQEQGDAPCLDEQGRSFFAAMRFNPDSDSDYTPTDYSTWYCKDDTAAQGPDCYSNDAKYKYWDHGPDFGSWTWSVAYLYGRRLLVTNADGSNPVVVRAVDKGPENTDIQGQAYSKRPIDLSPWAMGALKDPANCADWDGTDAEKVQCQLPADAEVTVCWTDNSLPPGIVSEDKAKCIFEQ